MENTRAYTGNIYAKVEEISNNCAQLEILFEELESLKGKLNSKEMVTKFLDLKIELDKCIEFCEGFFSLQYSDNALDENSSIICEDNLVEFRKASKSVMDCVLVLTKELLTNETLDLGDLYDINELEYKNQIRRLLKYKNWIFAPKELNDVLVKKFNLKLKKFLDFLDGFESDDIMDSKGNKVRISSYLEYLRCFKSPDRAIRQSAVNVMWIFIFSNGFEIEEMYYDLVKLSQRILENQERYNYLSKTIGISNLKAFDKIIFKIKKMLFVSRRYYSVKKEIMDVEKIGDYDKFVSVYTDAPYTIYSFEDIKNAMINANELLGKQYQEDLKMAFDNNWTNSIGSSKRENIHYCVNMYDDHPYIHQNFYGGICDVYELSVEFGKAMNLYYMSKNNPFSGMNVNVVMQQAFSLVNSYLTMTYLIDNEKDLVKKLISTEFLVQIFENGFIESMRDIELKHWIYKNEKNLKSFIDVADKNMDLELEYCGDSVSFSGDAFSSWLREHNFDDIYNSYISFLANLIAITMIDNLKAKGENYAKKYIEVLKHESASTFFDDLFSLNINFFSEDVITNIFIFYFKLIDMYKENSKFIKEK